MAAPPLSSSSLLLQRCGDKILRAFFGGGGAKSQQPTAASSTASSSSSSSSSSSLLPPAPPPLTPVPIWSCRRAHSLVPIRFSSAAATCYPFASSRFASSPDPLCLLDYSSTIRPFSTDFSASPPPPSSSSSTQPPPPSPPPPPPGEEDKTLHIALREGLPQLTVPLPSRNEPCVFTLKPVTHTVGDLLTMLRREDAGIDRAVIRTDDGDGDGGTRIAADTSVQTLLKAGPFQLVINDVSHRVIPPFEKAVVGPAELSAEEVARMGDVRALVGQLYEALHVEEHQTAQEQRLVAEIEALQAELMPLERQRQKLAEQAERRTNHLTWLGLGMMSVQFGILARLTWWEYSWDIMEPVTYFVTYGTAMACYAYWVLTKQDYILPDVRDRQFLISFHKRAKRDAWDADRYNDLKDNLQLVERDLRRLRDPLRLRLPASASSLLERGKGGEGGILASQININNLKSLLKDKLG